MTIGTVAQWLERRSYKAVAEGSIPSSPILLNKWEALNMDLDEQIQQIDIEIEAIELAIRQAMSYCEMESLISSVIQLHQKRTNLSRKNVDLMT